MKKQILTMFTGLFIGAIITGGASAYAAGILAERSNHRIFVDGQEVQMEAYGIAGHNYVKLRDMGKQVGFNVAKQDIVARTNALRAERGIAALAADDQLMRAAQVRADEMAATSTYSHTRPDGRKYYTVTDCRQVGENIHQIPLLYLAQQKTALAETLVYSWSKSAGHMENMTDESYAAIGVGLARGTDANGLECWYCPTISSQRIQHFGGGQAGNKVNPVILYHKADREASVCFFLCNFARR